ncbi:hypothetical protein CQ018_08275 [Arthrobacter sp. MYb227]|uniref:hypothetical protein n=1 Tax=Arthrobacter sp. MYb227 TaxID=1848601 RepID=UPI000CFC5CF3|nr:hypothetical protein [Arthrobacter sp. MYb227]PQZ93650.1 hypothetical protein CQ018_08275 [Arthrobacter sp. MYb227]
MLAIALGLSAILVTATTIWQAVTKSVNPEDPDASFWYAFTGACIYLPLLLIASAISPWAGAATLLLSLAAALSTAKHAIYQRARQRTERNEYFNATNQQMLTDRHDSVLNRWIRYELDPAARIDYPGMHDIHVPEISALTQALARAEQFRARPASTTAENAQGGYRLAITALEEAFQNAESKITGA